MRGIALEMTAKSTPTTINADLKELADLGASVVLLKTEEVQDDWMSVAIRPDPELTISLNTLTHAIREARRLKLQTVLMPIVHLQRVRSPKDWRGMIAPTDLARWFHSYGEMISKYARISQEEKVDLLCIGSELVSMERYNDEWERVIADVRRAFAGKIFYGFNWDHLGITRAWGKLDWIGVNGYHELAAEDEHPTSADLRTRWAKISTKVLRWRAALGKELLFTEIGYPSRVGGLHQPWDHTVSNGKVDLAVQTLGYNSFLDAWRGEKHVAGILFYEWQRPGGVNDAGYSPRGKPAEEILRTWFQGEEKSAAVKPFQNRMSFNTSIESGLAWGAPSGPTR